jgi:hypothetical protein
MEEWNRRPHELADSWCSRLLAIRLQPTATRTERARLAALRRCARQAVRRAAASERLRQVFQHHPESTGDRRDAGNKPSEKSETSAVFQTARD